MMPRPDRVLLAAVLLLGAPPLAAEPVTAAAFSAARPDGPLPAGWVTRLLPGVPQPTRYTLVDDGGITVLRADSAAGASAVSRALRVDPDTHPRLRWRWKVDTLVPAADIASKSGDDFPARIYVSFDLPLARLPFFERQLLRLARALFDADLPTATLCYVWDGKAPAGSIVRSAYSNRVQMVVVESGSARLQQWVTVERDLAADFRAAFGTAAPAVTGIAIAVDTDNTGGRATSFFGDIVFNKQ